MDDISPTRDRYRRAFILLLVAGVTAVFALTIWNFLLPLLMAAVFAALLHPMYLDVCRSLGGRRAIAAVIVIVTTTLAAVLPLLAMLGVVVGQAAVVAEIIVPWLRDQAADPGALLGFIPSWIPTENLRPYAESALKELGSQAGSFGTYVVQAAATATQGTIGFVVDLALMLYAMFFMFIHGPAIRESVLGLLPLAESDRALLVERGLAIIRVTLKSIVIVGVLQGLLVGVALWVAGVPGAAFWGGVAVVMSAVPALGVAIVWVPAAIWLAVSGDLVAAGGLVAWGALVIGTVDNVLRPLIVGREAHVPDLLILVGMLGGLAAFGPLGLLIGPILTALYLTALDIYRRAFADVLSG